MTITYSDLFMFVNMLVGIITLVITICNSKRK